MSGDRRPGSTGSGRGSNGGAPRDPVLDWLLDSDPSIPWQVLRDLTDAPDGDSPFFDGDGRWPLDVRHRDTRYEDLAGAVGAPNRWITLRARRVLDWVAVGPSGQESSWTGSGAGSGGPGPG